MPASCCACRRPQKSKLFSRESLAPRPCRRKLTPRARLDRASRSASTSERGASALAAHGLLGLALLARGQDLVDEAVLLGLRRAHVKVAVDVLVDEVLGLARGRGEDLGDDVFPVADLAGLDLDVGGLTARGAVRGRRRPGAPRPSTPPCRGTSC